MSGEKKKLGLRERQKVAVQKELREAAFNLFEERGFDDVSVAEIAAEAGISERTFFRHFATKEDVVLTALEGFGTDILESLESAELDRSWFEILRDTYVAVTSAERTAEGESTRYLQRSSVRVFELARGSARLQSGLDARARGWANDIAEVIARRSGLDIDRDPRPLIWATVAISAASMNSLRRVRLGMQADIQETFDALEEFLSKAADGL